MLNNKPDAQMYAYPELVEFGSLGSKYVNNSPMKMGCEILNKYIKKKKSLRSSDNI